MNVRISLALAAALVACQGDPSGAGDTDATTSGSTLPPTASATAGATEPETGSTSSGGVDDGPNTGVPPMPTLDAPADESVDQPFESPLCWNPVEDPDGDAVRYRVFIDDMELTQGELGEDGYDGPCTGPLTFNYEQTYTWEVQAFEADDPSRASARSEAWTFTTETDGFTHAVFEDDFDEDLGWELSGDAATGVWVRGDPAVALHDGQRSQSSVCGWGSSCYFTGQNPASQPEAEDVSGGSTILTSPEFDLSEAAAATVQLTRWFYKSEAEGGPGLRVELLVPDAGEPDGVAVHELELVDAAHTDAPANLWTPVEYAVCGAPMVPGSRLRITATDEGAGILEAGIDSVSVHAHDFATVCGSGEGGICDPGDGDAACPDDLICCSAGVINAGVFRCITPVGGIDLSSPPASPDDPGNGPLGCDAPDLWVDASEIEAQFSEIMVSDASCELLEGCVTTTGARRILRFALATPNTGSRDLALGVAANNPDIFHYSDCHNHYHFDEYARYQLLDGEDVVAEGHKQAFCLIDSTPYAWPQELPTYDCANQGISRGWGDIYGSALPCQWVDVTGVAAGNYTLLATLNQPRLDAAYPTLNERDYDNNTVAVPVTVE